MYACASACVAKCLQVTRLACAEQAVIAIIKVTHILFITSFPALLLSYSPHFNQLFSLSETKLFDPVLNRTKAFALFQFPLRLITKPSKRFDEKEKSIEVRHEKTALLNAPLSQVIATLGHTDSLTICDAGLPIPKQIERVDLALSAGCQVFFKLFMQ